MRRIRDAFTWVVLIGAIVVAALMLIPALFGFHRYAIESGSMEPAIPTGSVVYSKPAAAAQLEVGEVITYQPPPQSGVDELVTHRIFEKHPSVDQAGQPDHVFRTKGDANETPDPWHFSLEHKAADRAEAHIPYLGYVYLALAIPWVRILLITVPALLIVVFTVVALWREAGDEVAGAAEPGT